MSGESTRRYHALDRPLQEVISSRISLKKDEIKVYKEQLTKVLDENMLPAMGNADPLFKCLYKRLYYSGSSYEKLRISTPNEFDINVELEIPAKKIRVIETCHNGFVQLEVKELDPNKLARCFKNYNVGEERLKRWLDDAGLVKRQHVLRWMQGVVDMALSKVKIDHIEIKRSTPGPAITLNVTSRLPEHPVMDFSVDLVPVFIFGREHWPKRPVRQPLVSGPGPVNWCVVPKAPGYVPPETHWRMSFYNCEKDMMNGLNGMKPAIKLIKLLRDINKWNSISSYYIKTVFMWEMDVQDRNFWRQSIGFLFIHMLKKFVNYLKVEKAIPFYWDRRHSLISGLRPDTISQIGDRMTAIVKEIERNLPHNPEIVKSFFNSRSPVATLPSSIPSRDNNNHSLQQASSNVGMAVALGVGAAALAAGISFMFARPRGNNN